ncbi:MAG: SPOR domain-containing protein [Rubrivivax sp.]|nr:SPOR domain-containing protein [Rubrivivax sp.]
MALFSFLKRKDGPPPQATGPLGDDTASPEQAARTQARRRLIGAVVLLALGVLLFPLVFETQPRPLPTDIPIEMPRREASATARPAPVRPAPPPPVVEAPVAEPVAPAPAVATAPSAPAAAVPASSAPPEPPPRAAPAPVAVASAPAPAPERAARPASAPRVAAAPPAAASEARAGRFVVQVGAYTDAATLREVRAKVEKLGLKTYTQAVETEQGTRTRVRVGPFATRAEAEAASSRLKGAGLPGNLLVL